MYININERTVFMKITVNEHRCPQNHPCPAVRVCPVDAITQKGFGLPVIDKEKCIKCKKCILFCPMGAIQD
jgi:Fe-S-cluster-containing hydrogenase component 2